MQKPNLHKHAILLTMLQKQSKVLTLKEIADDNPNMGLTEREIKELCDELVESKALECRSSYQAPTCGWLTSIPRELKRLMAEVRKNHE
jgi:hypothetical protein